LKILLVIPYFYPALAFGGPAKVAFDIGRKMIKRGHELVVFTSDAKTLEDRLEIEKNIIEGMEVYYLKNLSMFFVNKSNLYITPHLCQKLKSSIHSFDIIHLHEYTTYQNIIVHKFAKKNHVPYILQAHGSLPNIGGRKIRKVLYNLFFGYRLLEDASAVIALNQIEAQMYRYMGISYDKIKIIPNGIDILEFNNLPSKGRFKEKFSIPEHKKIILFLGRIHKIKGLDFLIKAYYYLIKKLDHSHPLLVIVGPDNGYLDTVTSLVVKLGLQKHVVFTGPLYGRDKLEAYVDSDLYVLPSRYESFPITLLEAYACCKPVICTEVGGLRNNVVDGLTGILVKFGDVKQLAVSMQCLLNDVHLAEEMGLKAKMYVKKNFTIEQSIASLEDLFIKTCSSLKTK
jgi:glycosyltransferase involved in cell wall biosynthesis